ncbi:PREDICTED: uncharacterized protein LOC109236188 [Nicotiana attenuata]|uniref:uncharacterized protein LOC109236188 n=1 Tax=Nicotiana attenuata TaxID=49451 RepID=UPI000904B473|nr:PREDICTED: uncharacterized protein LOC109236188 [Nicotiana attenuata]
MANENSEQETPVTVTDTSQISSEDEFEEGISVPITHPLFLASTDTSGISLISFQLTGTDNFSLWYRSMKIALLGRNKLGMVDGRWKKEKFREKYWYQWERCNAIVLSWLMNAVALALISGIVYATNAHTVWMDLQERFDKKLYQFLMGLNDSYSQARSQILVMKPVPSVNQAYAMLMSEESQRNVAGSTCILGAGSNVISGHYESTALYSSKADNRLKRRKNFNLYCDFCKLKGHSKENCYKIVGYPADYKFKKKGGAGAYNAVAEYGSTSSNYNAPPELSPYTQPSGQPSPGFQMTTMQPRSVQTLQHNSHTANMELQPQHGRGGAFPFTKEQYDQIMQILNSNTVSSTSANNNSPTSTSQAHAAGTSVLLPNGDVTQVTHVGDSQISNNNTLKEELFNGRVKEIGRERDGLYFLQQHGNKRLTVVSLAIINTKADLSFLAFVHTQFNKIVKMVRSDNGSEFLNSVCKTVLNKLGILHQTTCAYTPQQNGVAERKHRHLLEITRALRFQAHIPIRFWGHCVITAAYLINRLPSSVLKGCSPYELLYKRRPQLEHLRTLGCLSFAKQVQETDKLMPRAKPVVLMGFSDIQKGYILLDISTQQFFVNRDVVF